jgi:serine protease AprX
MINYCTSVCVALCILLSTAHGAKPMQLDYAITLGEETFDPQTKVITTPTEWEAVSQHGNDLRLVQFDGPIQESWIQAMRKSGITPLQYIHPFTYITWADSQSRDNAEGFPHVRWSGDFLNGYRVLPKWRNLSSQPIDSKVMVYKGVELEGVLEQLRDAGAKRIDHHSLDSRFEIVSFVAPGSSYLEISRIPGIFTVQPKPTDGGLRSEMSNQVNAGNIDAGGMAYPGYQDWLNAAAGVTGDGVIVAIVDGGTDENHVDLSGQFVACSGQSCGGSASSSHGTHCAGTIGATGFSGSTDSNGFLQGQGVAPGVSLLEQVYSPVYQQPGGMTQLMVESRQNGALASSNSWGPAGSPQGYDIDTLEVDIAVRDADPDVEGNQQFTYVLAIMNGNGGTSSQGSPDEAKNIITVGSTKMRDGGGNQYAAINDISSNSAHGPCLDGRTIPHIVAPGCQTLSTVPGSYSLMCGTSMACPQVAGGVALFVEQYRAAYGIDPTPALTKAAFTASALDLAGNNDADGGTLGHVFDSKQGWGRMDLDSLLVHDEGSVRYYDAPVVLEQTGEQWSATVSPLDPSKPMKIMLVWTDALGHGLGGSTPAWNNDLDLTVSAGSSLYRGNNIGSQGWSITGGSADDKNNTEGVFLGPIPPGQATITVTAANLNSDGIPNEGDGIDQDFSVVCYNCASEPDFSMAIEPSLVEVCAPEETVCTVSIGQLMGYDNEVVLSVVTDSGILHDLSTFTVVPPAEVELYLNIPESVEDGEHIVQVVGIAPADGSMHEASVLVRVSSGLSSVPTLQEPFDGETEIPLAPTFSWLDDDSAMSWRLQISTSSSDSGIFYDASDIFEAEHALPLILDSNTPFFWRVRSSNNCGDSAWADWWTFRTTDAMLVLLVDDDDNSPDVRSDYTDMLDEAGILYEIHDTNNSNNEPSIEELQGYPLVIWFTGDEWGGFAGPGSTGEAALASYIENSGYLLLSSQDYLYDNGLTPFGQNYLGIGSFDSDVNQSTVTGENMFENVGSVNLTYPFTNYSDEVDASQVAQLAFSGSAGNAGTQLEGEQGGGAVFLGFPIEAMPAPAQQLLIGTVLEWMGGGSEPCAADCDNDGVVGVSDLLAIIDAWGTNAGCDLNGDGNIDVVDLLEVVGSWGECP